VTVGVISSSDGPSPTDQIAGVEAAAQAVNHNCEAGRPIKLIACNDSGDQSKGADCGRQVVSAGAIALVGSGDLVSNSYEPIVEGEGIPSIGNTATGITELAATTSFPFYNGLARIAAHCNIHAVAGAKELAIILPDSPAIQAQWPVMKEVCESFGVKVSDFIPVPIEASDLAQYASQAAESESIMILMDSKEEGLLRELANIGVTPENTVISAPSLDQGEVEEYGGLAEDLLMTDPTVPLNDTENEGVAQYIEESEAAGIDDLDSEGMVAWRSMHVVADLIKGLKDPTAQSLTKAVEKYKFAPPEAAPVNFTENAFPEIEVFQQFRIFSREYSPWVVKDGEITTPVDGFVDPLSDTKFNLE
jgi:ABC-type branched-subunit amino acid transport system substrate-binding protein